MNKSRNIVRGLNEAKLQLIDALAGQSFSIGFTGRFKDGTPKSVRKVNELKRALAVTEAHERALAKREHTAPSDHRRGRVSTIFPLALRKVAA